MKNALKTFIVLILSWQVRRLKKRHPFKVVAIAGSVGKTSTKFAIASVLSTKHRVRYQTGNYNDIVTVPLVYFGQELPSLFNPVAWLKVLLNNERQIVGAFPWDVIVLELGTDGPGQISKFGSFVSADVAVVTAIAPEHMEFFGTVDAVASEELSVGLFSNRLLVNADLCDQKYLSSHMKRLAYGARQKADYYLAAVEMDKQGQKFELWRGSDRWIKARHDSISVVQLYSLAAAAAVADILSMETNEITRALQAVSAVPGRLQLLKGINGSKIIDDTYNASPEAAKSALDALYALEAPTKVALLGNMNELGEYSEQAHTEVGEHCDPNKLDVVVTLGVDANNYLAIAAEKKGCRVKRVSSPYEAAKVIKPFLHPGAVLLAKGSQNGVFAEEAVKLLLADPEDAAKLVRQSAAWLSKKDKSFKPVSPQI